MKATIVDLRYKMTDILKALERKEKVAIMYHGKQKGVIIPTTPDFHLLEFEGGRVRLLLVFADIARALPELIARFDAAYLDGFAPDRNPAMWEPRTLRHLNRLATAGATLATWSVAGAVHEALRLAGFSAAKAPGYGGKREMTVGRFDPRHAAPAPPGRRHAEHGSVAIVGGALAGSAVGQALAAHGVPCTLLDERPPLPDAGASGFGGLFQRCARLLR